MVQEHLTNIATLANEASAQIASVTAQVEQIRADYDAAYIRINAALDAAFEALDKWERA